MTEQAAGATLLLVTRVGRDPSTFDVDHVATACGLRRATRRAAAGPGPSGGALLRRRPQRCSGLCGTCGGLASGAVLRSPAGGAAWLGKQTLQVSLPRSTRANGPWRRHMPRFGRGWARSHPNAPRSRSCGQRGRLRRRTIASRRDAWPEKFRCPRVRGRCGLGRGLARATVPGTARRLTLRARGCRRPTELQIDNGMDSEDEAEFEASLFAGEVGEGAVETAGAADPPSRASSQFVSAARPLDLRCRIARPAVIARQLQRRGINSAAAPSGCP